MKALRLLFLEILLSSACFAQEMIDPATPAGVMPANTNIGANWKLDFSDEFNSTALDTNKWQIDISKKPRTPRPKIGVSNWWWKADNVGLENGNLVLRVVKHDDDTLYCGSVNSNDRYETQYGYFETCIKIADTSKGTHTAFWFQGDQQGNVDGTANDGAEIDVFESAWLDDTLKAVVHIDGYGADKKAGTKPYEAPGLHDGYHIWGLYWTEEFMKIYYDGVLKAVYSDPVWVVKAKEYLWLSDGATFGLKGEYFTSQPVGALTQAYVDYVRVWKND